MIARGSAGETNNDVEIDAETEQVLQNRLKQSPVTVADLAEVRKQIREQVKADYQLVPPGYTRQWQIDLGSAKNYLANKPLQLRIKFNAANHSPSGTYVGAWQIGDPNSTNVVQLTQASLTPDNFHEFEIPLNLLKKDNGVNSDIVFMNWPTALALLFSSRRRHASALSGKRLHGEFYPRARRYFLLAGPALGDWPDGRQLPLLPRRRLLFPLALLAVAFSGGTLAEAVESGGTPESVTHVPFSDMIAMTPAYTGNAVRHQPGRKIFCPIDAGQYGPEHSLASFNWASGLRANCRVASAGLCSHRDYLVQSPRIWPRRKINEPPRQKKSSCSFLLAYRAAFLLPASCKNH